MSKTNSTSINAIEQGFCLVEMLFDLHNQPIDYRILEINSAFERHTGLKGAVGKTMRQLVPNHEEYWFEIYGKVALTGEKVHCKKFARALNRYYEVFAFPIEHPETRQVGILLQEIAESSVLVSDLRQAEADFLAAAALDGDGIYHCDFAGRFTYVNDNFCQMLDYSESELLGKSLATIMSDEDSTQNRHLLERMAKTSKPYRREQLLLRRDNTPIDVKMGMLPTFDTKDNLRCVCGVVRDSGRGDRQKTPLAPLLPWLQMAETSRDVFWVYDLYRTRILYVSPAYEQIWGRARTDLYRDASSWSETIFPGDRQQIAKAYNSTLQQGYSQCEYRIIRPDNTVRWIEDRGFVVKGLAGQTRYVAGVARDISDRKQAELQSQQENLRLKLLFDTSMKLHRHPLPKEQLPDLLDRFVSQLEIKYYFLYLLERDNACLRLAASRGIDEATRRNIEVMSLDNSICGRAIRSEGRFELSNVQTSSDPQQELLRSLGITAYACYSLCVGDRAVGTLSFGKDTKNSLAAEELTLLRYVRDLVEISLDK